MTVWVGEGSDGASRRRRQSSVRGGTRVREKVTGERTGLVGPKRTSLRRECRRVMERRDRSGDRDGEWLGEGWEGSGRKGFGFTMSFSIFMSRICQGRNLRWLFEIFSSWRFVRRQMSGGMNASLLLPSRGRRLDEDYRVSREKRQHTETQHGEVFH